MKTFLLLLFSLTNIGLAQTSNLNREYKSDKLDSGLVAFLPFNGGYGYGVVYGNTNLNDSSWYFVTGVYEGGTERTTKLYVDGKLDAAGVISSKPNTILGTN